VSTNTATEKLTAETFAAFLADRTALQQAEQAAYDAWSAGQITAEQYKAIRLDTDGKIAALALPACEEYDS
jgi:hypothetical protein